MKLLRFKMLKVSFYFLLLTKLENSFSQTQIIEMGPLNARIEINSDKDVYYTYEKIWISIKFENYSTETIIIPHLKLESQLKILDLKGQVFRLNYHYSTSDEDTVESGEVLDKDVNITRIYGSGLVDIYGDPEVLPPENYNINLVWNSVQFKDGEVLKYDPLVSNTIQIVVQDPTGDEKEAMDLFTEACKLRWNKEWNLSTEIFSRLADKFPNSIYASQGLKRAILNHKFKRTSRDREKTMRLSKKFVENYPDDNYSYTSLDFIIGDYKIRKDNAGAREYLMYLENRITDKQFKEAISNHLQKMK